MIIAAGLLVLAAGWNSRLPANLEPDSISDIQLHGAVPEPSAVPMGHGTFFSMSQFRRIMVKVRGVTMQE
jgi:hypothetical protein